MPPRQPPLAEQAPRVGVAARTPRSTGGKQLLQQHDLAAVEISGDGQLAEAFGGQLQRMSRGLELYPQPDVLLGQLAEAFGGQLQRMSRGLELYPQPDVLLGQLAVFRPRAGPPPRSTPPPAFRRPGPRLGRGQPPNHLDQQPPGQLVVVETARPGAAHGTD